MMKYCPYCGASLPGGAFSFCAACGKPLPVKGKPKSPRKSDKTRKPPGQRPLQRRAARDDGYDGYYDDIKPIDHGQIREGADHELVMRAVAISLGALGIIVASAILMSLL